MLLVELLYRVFYQKCELPRPHGRGIPTPRSPAPQSDLDPPTAEVPRNRSVMPRVEEGLRRVCSPQA